MNDIKSKKPAPSQASNTDLTVAEIVSAVPSTALTPAAINQASLAAATSASFDDRIAAAGAKLTELANQHPEYTDRLIDLSMYVAARIEGIVGDRGVPIPNLLVRQAMTKEENVPEGVKVGGFYTKGGDDMGNELNIIALLGHFKRVKFVQGQDRPECSSDDGVTGSKYGDCKTCAYQKYEEGARAACSSGYTFTAVTEDFTKLYQIDFTKTSSKFGRKLMQLAVPPALFATVFTIYTDKETNTKGTFYVTKVKPTGKKVTANPVEYEIARTVSQFATARFEKMVENRRAGRALSGGSSPAGAIGAGASSNGPDDDIDVKM